MARRASSLPAGPRVLGPAPSPPRPEAPRLGRARRDPLVVLAPAALALAACGGAPVTRPPDGAPNVLLISIDTLRADHLGHYGYERPTSPELDAFAETAVVFDSAQATASWTLPTLASILTSTYTSTHGCWDFSNQLDDSFTTLTERLLAAGYDTACVVSHIYCTPSYGLTQGFVHVGDELATPDVDPDLAITSHAISDRGIAFLDAKADAPDGHPWFLWLHYFDPHGEYVDQGEFTAAFVAEGEEPTELDYYDGEIAFTDHHVGRVLEALERNGQADATIVALVADHGEEFFDHGGKDHGHHLWGELIRVPMAIRAPGIETRRVAEMVRTVDLMPTVLDLAGLEPAHVAAGRSLVPAMRGESFEVRPALSELRLNPNHRFEGIVGERYKLMRRMASEKARLYDLAEDPLEQTDLAEERPELVERLVGELEELIDEAERLGEGFDRGPSLDLTPGQIEALGKLGYLGGEDEDPEEAGAGAEEDG